MAVFLLKNVSPSVEKAAEKATNKIFVEKTLATFTFQEKVFNEILSDAKKSSSLKHRRLFFNANMSCPLPIKLFGVSLNSDRYSFTAITTIRHILEDSDQLSSLSQ